MYIFAVYSALPHKIFIPFILAFLFVTLLWNWYSKPIRIFQVLSISICFTNIANSLFLVLESPKSLVSLISIIINFLIIGVLFPAFACLYGSQFFSKNRKKPKAVRLRVFQASFIVLLFLGYLPLLDILDPISL